MVKKLAIIREIFKGDHNAAARKLRRNQISALSGTLNYTDDLIYCGLPSTIDTSYQFLLDLLQELGLDISHKKLCSSSTKVVCLGILFDTIQRTISIPEVKLICSVCHNRMVTKSELQSLLGLLLYITKCVKLARFFLNRMLQLLKRQF